MQENSYYAYGMSMTSTMSLPTAPNKNLYNGGSEWQNDFADQPDWQQTFYRNYDQTIGRFLAVDPMAEVTGDMSVYQYGNNNPVAFNDPLGDLSKKEIESFGPLKYAGGLSSAFWMKTYASEQDWSYAQDFFKRAAAIAGATSIYSSGNKNGLSLADLRDILRGPTLYVDEEGNYSIGFNDAEADQSGEYRGSAGIIFKGKINGANQGGVLC